MELEGVNGHEQEQHETCDGQIQLTAGRRIRWLLKNVKLINQHCSVSAKRKLEEVSKHELEQQTRRQLLISSALQTNDTEPRLFSRVIIRHGQQLTHCF